MSDAPLILGVSGLRGIVGESLTPEVAVRYAGAFGSWLRENRRSVETVVVGRDGRAGGEVFYYAVISALLGMGFDVEAVDFVMTPTMGVLVDTHAGVAAGLIITASHNPLEWNGIKALLPSDDSAELVDASAPSASDASEIIEAFQGGDVAWTNYSGELIDSVEMATEEHVATVRQRVFAHFGDALLTKHFVAVTDCVNASGGFGSSALLQRLGVRSVPLFSDGSGIFPHTPEPTRENLSGKGGLCDAVPGLKADVGFAQDPDADRLAIVDEKGNYIGEEYTLVLCATALMEARASARAEASETRARGSLKPVFVVNLSTSRMIDDIAARYGAEVVRTPVGEANVVEVMKRLKAEGRDVVMGGEGNGGVIWPEVTYVRDSLSAMALTLALMARTGKTVSELVAMVDAMGPGGKGYCIVKRKAPLASKADAEPVVRHLAEVFGKDAEARVDTQDGVRIDWDARGVWAHIRASNTEPIMRVIVEAPTEPLANETAALVESRIAEVRAS
ncbi:MAG: phosphoglucosamine mutase [Planctomycetota bacterium]|nr:MAG: phosphoglucosamine mutase [Planctomycetota bacterium]